MDENLARIELWMLSERKCYVCGTTYTNKTSVGMHQCREHFGIIRDGKYTCCQRAAPRWAESLASVYEKTGYMSAEDKGCISADHNAYGAEYVPYSRTNPDKGDGTITMPLHIYKLFDIGIKNPETDHEITVWQYDEKAKPAMITKVKQQKLNERAREHELMKLARKIKT
jgi:hypothetical protein